MAQSPSGQEQDKTTRVLSPTQKREAQRKLNQRQVAERGNCSSPANRVGGMPATPERKGKSLTGVETPRLPKGRTDE